MPQIPSSTSTRHLLHSTRSLLDYLTTRAISPDITPLPPLKLLCDYIQTSTFSTQASPTSYHHSHPQPRPPPGSSQPSQTGHPNLQTTTAASASAAANVQHPTAASGGLKTPAPPLAASRAASGQPSRSFSSDAAGRVGSMSLDHLMDSVVKINTVYARPNFYMPWQTKPSQESQGTGFFIELDGEMFILTNAHVVTDSLMTQVRRQGSSKWFQAEVVAEGHECDLALLRAPEGQFRQEPAAATTLQFGPLPQLQEQVMVAGWPLGGDNVSFTIGAVSRLDMVSYQHTAATMLAVQIDAAINPGNSGGPALQDSKVVGVAFQSMSAAENMGYLVPVPVIQHFLGEYLAHGKYQGHPMLGISCQPLVNPQMRRALGLELDERGVLVTRVQSMCPCKDQLKAGDVLIELCDQVVASDGSVSLRGKERVTLDHLLAVRQNGEQAHMKVIRGGKEIAIDFVCQPVPQLVPSHKHSQQPSYYIYGGLVFTVLTQPYLHEYGNDWVNKAPRNLVHMSLFSKMRKPDEQIVILSQVLTDANTVGLHCVADLQVQKVNGVEVLNLKHLREMLEASSTQGQFIRLDMSENAVVWLDGDASSQSNPILLKNYNIPRAMSQDMCG